MKNGTKYFKFENHNKKNGKTSFIIHISGPSGSGKTTLGDILKKSYHNKIIVKDIDDLGRDFMN